VETIAFRLDPRMKRLLEAVARMEGRSLGEVLREAVAEWLNERAKLHKVDDTKSEDKI